MRFSVSSEEPLSEHALPAHLVGAEINVVRVKTRYSYNHKREVMFDLTEVRSGHSEAVARGAHPEYEVELEWCGQAVAQRYKPDQLAEKFLCKIVDLLGMKFEAEQA